MVGEEFVYPLRTNSRKCLHKEGSVVVVLREIISANSPSRTQQKQQAAKQARQPVEAPLSLFWGCCCLLDRRSLTSPTSVFASASRLRTRKQAEVVEDNIPAEAVLRKELVRRRPAAAEAPHSNLPRDEKNNVRSRSS